MSLIFDAVSESAKALPHKSALIWKEHDISYSELAIEVTHLCNTYNFRRRVAMYCNNPILFAKAYFAVLHCGGELVIIPEKTTEHELDEYIAFCNIELLVTDQASFVNREITVLCLAFEAATLHGNQYEAGEEKEIAEPIIIFPTSGSTASPKHAVFHEANLMWNAQAHNKHLHIDSSHTVLCILPLTSIFGHVTQFLSQLINGGTVVFYTGFFGTQDIWRYFHEYAIDSFGCVPTHLRLLKKLSSEPHELNRLNFILVAGAPLRADEYETFQAHFPTNILHAYGLTEAGPRVASSTLEERSIHEQYVSVGKALAGVNLKIVDNGEKCSSYAVGELAVKSPSMMQKYWNNADQTNQVIQGDWLLTGDLGFIDDAGFLYIVGRKKTTMIVGGKTIYPEEIEQCLRSLGVEDAAVTSIQDQLMGEQIIAFIKRDQAMSLQTLKCRMNEKLSPYKIPRRFMVVDEIPKNRSGKIERHKLTSLL